MELGAAAGARQHFNAHGRIILDFGNIVALFAVARPGIVRGDRWPDLAPAEESFM